MKGKLHVVAISSIQTLEGKAVVVGLLDSEDFRSSPQVIFREMTDLERAGFEQGWAQLKSTMGFDEPEQGGE